MPETYNGEICYPENMEEAINCKISLLKDFGFLRRQTDWREPVVRAILSNCKTLAELDNTLHDVVRFEETLDAFIARNGGIKK